MEQPLSPVREFRHQQQPRLTLAALAKRIGTTKENLSRIETGKQGLSLKMAKALSRETGIPAAKLLDLEPA